MEVIRLFCCEDLLTLRELNESDTHHHCLGFVIIYNSVSIGNLLCPDQEGEVKLIPGITNLLYK